MFNKMVYSDYTKKRIVYYYQHGRRAPAITSLLQQEGLQTSRVGVAKFIAKFNATGLVSRKPGSGIPSKITAEIKAIVEAQMREDDETTAYQLHSLLLTSGFLLAEEPYFVVVSHWVGHSEEVLTAN